MAALSYFEVGVSLPVNLHKSVIGLIISLITIGFLLWSWLGTDYKIEGGLIKIRCGPFKSTVKIEEIEKVSATNIPLSAPALSFDRIEILHGKYNTTIGSPKDKSGFIRVLVTENPAIQTDKKTFY